MKTSMKTSVKPQSRLVPRTGLSIGILLAALGLTYAPLPGIHQTVVVVSGTELQEPLQVLEAKFEQTYPQIQLELQFQGSQDLVNRYIDAKNDFTPTVLIPANGELIAELGDRWQAQNRSDPFYEPPRPIAKTNLVAIAWAERGKVLFPNHQFDWNRLERALQKGDWGAIGGPSDWGSFDLLITDPTRSNSAQLTLGLWAESELGSPVTASSLNSPQLDDLFGLVKRSVYQPPRSTDTLLQEFIARGPNQADVATVYESIALHRWQQSAASQTQPYQIYYINPTVETVSTAAIVRRNVSQSTANAARQFLDFLTAPEQQQTFVQYGFRPVNAAVDLQSTPNSPWTQNIPGAEITPPGVAAPPNQTTLSEIVRLWQRAQ
jgi:ABC-type Fe3+ transport system substrate-binding protein